MEYRRYFWHIIEFSELMRAYRAAPLARRPELAEKIQSSEFLTQLRQAQTFSEENLIDQLNRGQSGEGCLLHINTGPLTEELKHDFFINMAIPTHEREDKVQMPLHRHNYLEMIFVQQGRYIQYINGILHEHRAGDFCLMNPNVMHHDIAIGPEDVVFFFCMGQNYVHNDLARAFSTHPELKSFMEYQLGRRSQQYILFRPGNIALVEEVVEQLLRENYEKLPGHHLVVKGLLLRIFSLLVNGESYEVHQQNEAVAEEYLIAQIVQYMKSNLSSISRTQTAAQFHFNPDYLNRLLERGMGRTYTACLRDLRLQEAERLLKSSGASVNEIIRSLGFSNKGYFNRIFKERFGVLPGEYRTR